MAMDGKTIRLRASCNACNESKVRCSQRKPTCARCERNGTECIYGLSRRTHKDAPPISMPSSASQRPRGPSRTSSFGDMKKNNSNNTNGISNGYNTSNGNSNGSLRGLSFPKSGTATPSTSNSNASPERSAGTHDATLFEDYMSPAGHFMIPPQQQNNTTATVATPQFHLYNHTPHVPTSTAADPSHGAGLPLLDFGLDVVTGTSTAHSTAGGSGGGIQLDDPLSAVVTRFPTPTGLEYGHHPWATTDMDMDTFWTQHMTMPGGPPTTAPPSPPPAPCGECTCHAGVTELLSSMRGGAGDDRRLPPDAQLAKLKRCIASSEASMGCVHIREDAEPIHIMSVATLIGYVINEFEMLAYETQMRRSSPSSSAAAAAAAAGSEMTGLVGNTDNTSGSLSSGSDESMSGMVTQFVNMSPGGGNGLKPRLSWGVLELEDDDEVDLRQRLYLLSFRKLERLLSQLTLYLRSLHDARAGLPDPSRHMAFVMACDYTRLWLEKKAEDVKRLFSVTVGDETVDPTLV